MAVTSEGRPVNADIQLWLGPDWTPFTLKAYSEGGNSRPIPTLVGTRTKAAMIEVRNVGEYESPFTETGVLKEEKEFWSPSLADSSASAIPSALSSTRVVLEALSQGIARLRASMLEPIAVYPAAGVPKRDRRH